MIYKRVFKKILSCGYLVPLMLLSLMAAAPADVLAQNVVVISNKDVSVSSLNKEDVKQVFLGRKTRWSDDRKIKFVTLRGGEAHTEFVKKYVRKTPSQFRVFWKKMIFTGKGRAPKSFSSPEELVDFVANTPGAIGYVPAEKAGESVNVISVN